MNKRIAIVMARGGSKRVPHKNVRSFCGQPMVTWAVQHAVNSGLFSQVMISTDSEEIAEAAVNFGAVYSGPRSPEFSNDHATTPDVLRYELNSLLKNKAEMPEVCCCLYGTSAMATPEMLQQGLALLNTPDTDLALAVMRYSHPIERALVMDNKGKIDYKKPEFAPVRTQDLPTSYYDTGLFYWFRVPEFLKYDKSDFSYLRMRGLIVSRYDSVDIDTEEEWEQAEQLAKMHNLGNSH